jgi:uncharacterized BrkB/YihY/UPF0761 family membrane protein
VFELLVGARPRSWLRQRAIATAWVLTVLVATVFCVWFILATTGWLEGIRRAADLPELLGRVRDGLTEGWKRVSVIVVFGSVTTVGLAAFYRIAVVQPAGIRRRVWWGTFVAISLWAVVSWAFGRFVGTIGQYSVYYGSLATVAVTLLWFYLTSLAFLIGAEVNAQLEGVRDPPSSPAL